MLTPRPVDWFGVLRDLRYQSRMTLADVARELGAGKSTVKAWWLGRSEPKHSTGEALITLYVARVGAAPPRKGKPCNGPKTAQHLA